MPASWKTVVGVTDRTHGVLCEKKARANENARRTEKKKKTVATLAQTTLKKLKGEMRIAVAAKAFAIKRGIAVLPESKKLKHQNHVARFVASGIKASRKNYQY